MEQAEKKFARLEGRGVGGSSRRRIRHIAPNKPQIVNTVPSRESGQNGDIVYYQDPRNLNRVFQYVKLNNRWLNLSDGRPIEDSARTKKFVKARTE
jgi:signal peptidase I|tara:strand:+ start:530 stop:817 length:288 start_codon:yes stop_codon:yes gene_type:complete